MDQCQRSADCELDRRRRIPTSSKPGSEHRLRSRLADDSGEIPTIFVMFSLTMVVFFCVAHFTLVFYGRSVMSAAAQDGLAAAQLENGTVADGQAAISQTMALANNVQLTSNPVVTIDGNNSVVRVRMTGEVTTALLPLVNTFSIELMGPKERFYAEDERP